MSKVFAGKMTPIGEFELTTPIMRVSDPCYEREVWCCGTIANCKTGTWEAAVLYRSVWGQRVAVLAVRHKETGPDFTAIRKRGIYTRKGLTNWEHQSFEVGVDSGQAGFFDEAFYQDDSVFDDHAPAKHEFDTAWYNHACDTTLADSQAGVIPYGAVSRSGIGDGGYDCFTHENADGELDFAFIVFLWDED